jgi:hypothetical protein
MDDSGLLSVDRLLAEGWFSADATSPWPVIADYNLDGSRLGSQPYRMRPGPRGAAPSPHETRLEQAQGEAFLAATILWRLGYRGIALSKTERPDFVVDLDNRQIGLEISEIVEEDSARWCNAIEDLRIIVRDAVDANPAIIGALQQRYVSISFWHCPKRSVVTALRDEIVAFLAAGAAFALPQSRVVDQRFPLLTEHWVRA